MEILITNKKRRLILSEILHWRYLGISEISEATGWKSSKRALERILVRMEKAGLVQSFSPVMVTRKFWFASKFIHSQYIGEGKWHINEEIKTHDTALSAFLFRLSQLPMIDEATYFESIKERSMINMIEPDGHFYWNLNGRKIFCALEIELNRKNQEKIKSKMKTIYEGSRVLGDSPFRFVFYLFTDMKILEAYKRYHSEVMEDLGLEVNQNRIFFLFTDQIFESNFDVCSIDRVRLNGEIESLGGLFL